MSSDHEAEIRASVAAHQDLGSGYDEAVAEGLVERIGAEIDKRIDARLGSFGTQYGPAPGAPGVPGTPGAPVYRSPGEQMPPAAGPGVAGQGGPRGAPGGARAGFHGGQNPARGPGRPASQG